MAPLSTRAVFLDDASILAKFDPGRWPEGHGNVESRASNDEVTEARKEFLSCRLDPDDLEAQLAKLTHP
jgi:hypothetical protein